MATPPTSSDSFNGVVATLGAAGGVGAFILLLFPKDRGYAVWAAVLIVVVGLGVVSYLQRLP